MSHIYTIPTLILTNVLPSQYIQQFVGRLDSFGHKAPHEKSHTFSTSLLAAVYYQLSKPTIPYPLCEGEIKVSIQYYKCLSKDRL